MIVTITIRRFNSNRTLVKVSDNYPYIIISVRLEFLSQRSASAVDSNAGKMHTPQKPYQISASRPTNHHKMLPKSSTSSSFCEFLLFLFVLSFQMFSAAVRSSGYGQSRAKTPSDGFGGETMFRVFKLSHFFQDSPRNPHRPLRRLQPSRPRFSELLPILETLRLWLP